MSTPYKYLKPFRTLSNISWIHGASKEKPIRHRNKERTGRALNKFVSATTGKAHRKTLPNWASVFWRLSMTCVCDSWSALTKGNDQSNEVPSDRGALPNPEGSTQIRKCHWKPDARDKTTDNSHIPGQIVTYNSLLETLKPYLVGHVSIRWLHVLDHSIRVI